MRVCENEALSDSNYTKHRLNFPFGMPRAPYSLATPISTVGEIGAEDTKESTEHV